jgi:hypothetical protein
VSDEKKEGRVRIVPKIAELVPRFGEQQSCVESREEGIKESPISQFSANPLVYESRTTT